MKRLYSPLISYRLRYLLVLVAIASLNLANGQDIHFSQFMTSPMNLNPAHTGNFEGALRIVGNARQQWNSVTLPYQTFGLGVDAKKLLGFKNISGGIGAYNDRTGDSRLNTFIANTSIAFTLPFNKKGLQGVTFGVTGGLAQRSIDYSNLNYNNQYKGTAFDPAANNNEVFSTSSHIKPNIHAGIAWFKHKDLRNKLNTGVALYHITTPDQSFFDSKPSLLDRKLNLHASLQRSISEKIDLMPAALLSLQGAYTSINVGTAAKYILNADPTYYRAVYLGIWTRVGDAAWLTAGMDYGNLYACISYDFNYSGLQAASNKRGGAELSVVYIIKQFVPKRRRYLSCPDFL